MNKKGEIKKLSKMVRPELAVITAIENSHLQGLKNLRNIALAKSEILDYLPKSGCIVFNKDTNYSELIEKKILKLSIKTKISYGREAKSDIKLMNYKLDGPQYVINASCFGKKLSWKMPAIGEHWIINSLALIGVGKYYDLDIDKILSGLVFFNLPSGRGNIIKLNYKNKKVILIDDSYNSNPASLSAAIRNLLNIKNQGKKILVLGDMLELGKQSDRFHKNLKYEIEDNKNKIGTIITIGNYMYQFHKAIRGIKKAHTNNLDELFYEVKKNIDEDSIVLVKGSNSLGLKGFINKIKKMSVEL